MYCSSCGAPNAEGLAFCNRCGTRLDYRLVDLRVGRESNGRTDSEGKLLPDFLIWAMVATFVFGLGVITGLMAVMKAVVGFNDGLIIFFTLVSFLLLVSLEGVLLSLLFRRTRTEKVGNTLPLEERETGGGQGRLLQGEKASVTEHTTRSIDQIYVEGEK